MTPITVVVVGGGAAGTLAAIHLARHPSGAARRVVVVEPAGELGSGAAYGTRSPSHLLNVRAMGMSAYPDDPDHFLAWAGREGVTADGADFLPRMLYGRYLRDVLAGAAEHVRGRVIGLSAGSVGWRVALESGEVLDADHVILATGNTVAAVSGVPDHARIVPDPWAPDAIDGLRDARDVVLVGSGLTAVDVALSLRDIGHPGRLRMISSHGLLPEPHAPVPLPTVPPFVTSGDRAARSVRAALAAARDATNAAGDWRQVVDGIRPQTVALWRALPAEEQRRFLRHVSRRWDVRRHRMAPRIALAVRQLQERGQLSVERGRLARLEVAGDQIRVFVTHAGNERVTDTDAVVMCIGPTTDPRRDPFLAGLLRAGVTTRHPLGMGLVVDIDGRLVAPNGVVQQGLWAMGSLRKGAEWESTAVPELRSQARDIASSICATAGSS